MKKTVENANDNRSEWVTRDAILNLLSDDETARVSTMEASHQIAVGEEYIDLGHLDQGIRRVDATTRVKISEVLTRSTVSQDTWSKICARLAAGNRN